MDRDNRYIQVLLLILVAAVVGDMLLGVAGLERLARRLVLWVLTAPALYFVLTERTRYLGASRYWALSAAVPALGVLVGVALYFQNPQSAEGSHLLDDRQS